MAPEATAPPVLNFSDRRVRAVRHTGVVALSRRRSPAGEDSDTVLWETARHGGADAFGVLFDRHHPAVLNYCYRRLLQREAAEEAMSQVFLEAWRSRSRLLLVDASCRPWLLGIANNVVRNAERTDQRRHVALGRLAPAGPQDGDHATLVADRVDSARTARRLVGVINLLPWEDRELISLVLLGDLTTREASQVLGVAEGTVKARVHRLRRRLLDELDACGETPVQEAAS